MGIIIEAVDLVVGGPWSTGLSLGVATAEIVGLLFPPDRPRAPVLRVLAGLDAAFAGAIRFPGRARVVVATPGRSLSDVLSAQPDLVLLDVASDVVDRNLWARLASERALGTSFVVATSSLEQACRGDRVSPASWDMDQLTRAVAELLVQMTGQTHEWVARMGEPVQPDTARLARDLRRLNVASRVLLGEMGRCARPGNETAVWRAAALRVAGVSVSDHVLDAVIAEAGER
jgi:hypothetical protein